MTLDWRKYVPFAKDLGERAAKSFAGGFIVGGGLLSAAVQSAAGDFTVAASQINWERGADFGLGTLFCSILFSIGSARINDNGKPPTASLTKAVEAVPEAKS